MLMDLFLLLILVIFIPVILLADIMTLGGKTDNCAHSYWWRHKKEMGKVIKKLL